MLKVMLSELNLESSPFFPILYVSDETEETSARRMLIKARSLHLAKNKGLIAYHLAFKNLFREHLSFILG